MRTKRSGAPLILALVLVTATVAACGGQPNTPQPPEPGLAGLELTVDGLPAGLDARVTVTHEGVVVAEVEETVTLPALEPGEYTVVAEEVGDGGGVYVPDPPHAVVRLTADEVGSSLVEYRLQDPSLGSVTLTITGLPLGPALSSTSSPRLATASVSKRARPYATSSRASTSSKRCLWRRIAPRSRP